MAAGAQDRGYAPCEVAVMWGAAKRTMPATRCRDEIVAAHGSRPLVRLERGYLRREQYESVGLGGLWGNGDYRNADSPDDRFAALCLEIRPWQPAPDGHALVMGQVPSDTAVPRLRGLGA